VFSSNTTTQAAQQAKQARKGASFPWPEEKVRKSSVVDFLEDVFGAHALGHLRKLRLGKISPQARESLHLP
jgi:hypothetical protein